MSKKFVSDLRPFRTTHPRTHARPSEQPVRELHPTPNLWVFEYADGTRESVEVLS